MDTNIKFIKFFSIASVITFIICYILYLFPFEKSWLSTSFLTSIFSGIFASFLVVLITELKKYFVNKKAAENQIYWTCLHMYTELVAEIQLIDTFLDDTNAIVPEKVLSNRMPNIQYFINQLHCTNYVTINKHNKFFLQFQNFETSNIYRIQNYVNNSFSLDIAIKKEKIFYLQNGSHQNPTAQNSLVNEALKNIKVEANTCKTITNDFLDIITSFFPKQFDWKANKEEIDKMGTYSENKNVKNFL